MSTTSSLTVSGLLLRKEKPSLSAPPVSRRQIVLRAATGKHTRERRWVHAQCRHRPSHPRSLNRLPGKSRREARQTPARIRSCGGPELYLHCTHHSALPPYSRSRTLLQGMKRETASAHSFRDELAKPPRPTPPIYPRSRTKAHLT